MKGSLKKLLSNTLEFFITLFACHHVDKIPEEITTKHFPDYDEITERWICPICGKQGVTIVKIPK